MIDCTCLQLVQQVRGLPSVQLPLLLPPCPQLLPLLLLVLPLLAPPQPLPPPLPAPPHSRCRPNLRLPCHLQ